MAVNLSEMNCKCEVIPLRVITLKNFLFGRNYSLLSLRLRKAEKVLNFEKEKHFLESNAWNFILSFEI